MLRPFPFPTSPRPTDLQFYGSMPRPTVNPDTRYTRARAPLFVYVFPRDRDFYKIDSIFARVNRSNLNVHLYFVTRNV